TNSSHKTLATTTITNSYGNEVPTWWRGKPDSYDPNYKSKRDKKANKDKNKKNDEDSKVTKKKCRYCGRGSYTIEDCKTRKRVIEEFGSEPTLKDEPKANSITAFTGVTSDESAYITIELAFNADIPTASN